MNAKLTAKYGKEDIITGMFNYQVVLNEHLIDSAALPENEIVKWIITYTLKTGCDRTGRGPSP